MGYSKHELIKENFRKRNGWMLFSHTWTVGGSFTEPDDGIVDFVNGEATTIEIKIKISELAQNQHQNQDTTTK